MRANLKKKFVKLGRLFGMNSYLRINRTRLQYLASLQESSEVLETDQSFDVLLYFFPCPLHNTENENAFKEKFFGEVTENCRSCTDCAIGR